MPWRPAVARWSTLSVGLASPGDRLKAGQKRLLVPAGGDEDPGPGESLQLRCDSGARADGRDGAHGIGETRGLDQGDEGLGRARRVEEGGIDPAPLQLGPASAPESALAGSAA